MTDWHIVLGAVSDYMNKQLPLLKLHNHTMSVDPKIRDGLVEIKSMSITPADGKTWEEILEPLGAKKKSYEFAILLMGGKWVTSSTIKAYSEKEAEELVKSELEMIGFNDVSGILLMREWRNEEE
jgi:hypothetical protein